jgi:hypothetical protein
MARDPEAINQVLMELVQPQARGRLLTLGLARGMVWRDGIVPDGVPARLNSAALTPDLLDFGYGVLSLALELRDANREREADRQFATSEAFRVAAEAIESAVRRGDPTHGDQGRHLIVSAAAFHLAGYAARSFSLLPIPALEKNLASHERSLGLLLRRDLVLLRAHIIQWHANAAHSDEAIAGRLLDEADEFGAEDAAVLALVTSYHRGLGLADTALVFGDREIFDAAVRTIEIVVASAAQIGNIPTWSVATLTLHLLRDLWNQSLHVVLPSGPNVDAPKRWNDLKRDFIAQLGTRRPPHIELWPSQIAAAGRAIDPADDLVIALPTSAGKTRIAELCILRALADGKIAKALNEAHPLTADTQEVSYLCIRVGSRLGLADLGSNPFVPFTDRLDQPHVAVEAARDGTVTLLPERQRPRAHSRLDAMRADEVEPAVQRCQVKLVRLTDRPHRADHLATRHKCNFEKLAVDYAPVCSLFPVFFSVATGDVILEKRRSSLRAQVAGHDDPPKLRLGRCVFG